MSSNAAPVAAKNDSGKLPLDLLDADALEGIAAVLQFGAKKYAPHNWRKGFTWSRLLAALLRHTFAIMKGELIDKESGLPHIDHVGCCWMFLSNHMKKRRDLNDLWWSRAKTRVSTEAILASSVDAAASKATSASK